jgi:hypothetical protein
MEDNNDIYDNIKDVINSIPDNYRILEETINIDTQKEYYESSKGISIDPALDVPEEMINQLNEGKFSSTEDCKILLQKLALLDSVEAYRTIEKFCLVAPPEIKEWAILAKQQSRMVMQCSLLDEQQVFISTGLGGKNDKLRYLLIFPFSKTQVSQFQLDALEKELLYFLPKNDGEVEEFVIQKKYATSLILLPLKAPVNEIIQEILAECNQFGNFLSHNAMITNMKKFSHEEISAFIEEGEEK